MSDGRYDSYVLAVEGRREAEAEVARLREELADVKSEALARWRALNESLAFNRALESEAAALRRQLDEARSVIKAAAGVTGNSELCRWLNEHPAFLAPPVAAPPPCAACGGDGYFKGPRLGDEPCPACKGTGREAASLTAVPREPTPLCASLCGTDAGEAPQDARDMRSPGRVVRWCTPACRDAGAPRNPVKPCETCGGAREAYFDDAGMLARGYMRPCPTCTPGAKG